MSKHIPWAITVFLTLIFWLHTCNLNRKIDKGEAQITQLELDNQELNQIVNKYGSTIQIQESIISDNSEALGNLTDSIFDLKKKQAKNLETIAYFKEISKVQIRDIQVPYLDSQRMKVFSDSVLLACRDVIQYMNDSTIKVPRVAGISQPHFSITTDVTKQGLNIKSLSIPDTLQMRFVNHKGGLFKKDKVEVQWFHSNPYIVTSQANSVFFQPKRKSFFQRVVLPVAVGIGVGVLISK